MQAKGNEPEKPRMPGIRGWLTSLGVNGFRISVGRSTDVITGVVATTGGLQVAMKTDDAWITELSVALDKLGISLEQVEEKLGYKLDSTIILPPGSAAQLIVNLREVVVIKMQREG
jgi:hypothetical protein